MSRIARHLIAATLSLGIPALSVLASPVVAHADQATYTVKPGDSLSGIAAKLGVKLADLLSTNSITITSVILPGQSLIVPSSATNAGGAGHGTTGSYTIKAGDSLSMIASRHKITLKALLAANNMTATSLITPGMTIALPAGASTPASPPPAAPPGAPQQASPIDAVIAFALAQEGKPYQFFTAGPDSFDCSGLTKAAYAQIGITLPHQSSAQAMRGTAVDLATDSIRPGDLVFLKLRGSDVINHVGLAISSSKWIHATRPGGSVQVGWIPKASSIAAVVRLAA